MCSEFCGFCGYRRVFLCGLVRECGFVEWLGDMSRVFVYYMVVVG